LFLIGTQSFGGELICFSSTGHRNQICSAGHDTRYQIPVRMLFIPSALLANLIGLYASVSRDIIYQNALKPVW